MALQSSGQISFSNILSEFNQSGQKKLSDLYRLQGIVDVREENVGVPLSGQISLSDFYGTSSEETVSYNKTFFSLGTSTQSETETYTAYEVATGTLSWSTDWQVGDRWAVLGSDVNEWFGYRTGTVAAVDSNNRPTSLIRDADGGYNFEFSSRNILNERTGSISSSATDLQYTEKTAIPTFDEDTSFSISGTLVFDWRGTFEEGDILYINSPDVDPYYGPRILMVNSLNSDDKPNDDDFTQINSGGYRKNLSIREITNQRTGTISYLSGTQYSSISGSEVSSSFVTEPEKKCNILIVGQSNIAYIGSRFFGYAPYDRENKFVRTANGDGDLVRAITPLGNNHLPSSGDTRTGTPGSGMDGIIGDLIIDSTSYTSVDVYNVAVGGTRISEWRASAPSSAYGGNQYDDFNYTNNKLFERIEFAVLQASLDNNPFTHVFLAIGESDGLEGTTKQQFKDDVLGFIQDLRNEGITSHILLAKTTYVNGSTDSEIRQAVDELVAENNFIYAGPDTDQYGSSFRYDDIHFNSNGLQEVASDWVAEFLSVTP